jgi:hypothetical protein
MRRTLTLAVSGSALLLAGCVAVPAYEPTYGPAAPAVVVAPPAVVVQPYLAAHWGYYYRGPYARDHRRWR